MFLDNVKLFAFTGEKVAEKTMENKGLSKGRKIILALALFLAGGCATTSSSNLEKTVEAPANCLLENRLAKKQGIDVMADWKADLNRFIETFGDDLLKEARKR